MPVTWYMCECEVEDNLKELVLLFHMRVPGIKLSLSGLAADTSNRWAILSPHREEPEPSKSDSGAEFLVVTK